MGKRRDEKLGWVHGLRGRRQWKESDARRVLQALAESGDTLAGFARQHGLTPQRISWWRVRLGDWVPAAQSEKPPCVPSDTGFISVLASQSGSDSKGVVAVVRVGDIAIDVCDPSAATTAWVASFIDALGVRA